MTMFGSQWLANAGSTYEIDQSIRFNYVDDPSLTIDYGSAGNRRTYTYSVWFKRSFLTGNFQMGLFGSGADQDNRLYLRMNTALQFVDVTGGEVPFNVKTNAVLRDPSSWYHVVLAVDTTDSTASNRVKIYINGTLQTSLATASYPTENLETRINSTDDHYISLINNSDGSSEYDGYMAEINFIDGTQAAATAFGETNAKGQWVPIEFKGTYGSNGFYLKGQDSSALGDDSSGNGNDWTTSNLAANDQMSDSPTNNWCTLNSLSSPLTRSSVMSEGNLKWRNTSDGTSFFIGCAATQRALGKCYWEVTNTYDDTGSTRTGLFPRGFLIQNDYPGGAFGADCIGLIAATGRVDRNGVAGTTYTGADDDDVNMYAFDENAGKLWIGLNGTWFNSGDPAGGTGEVAGSIVQSPLFPATSGYGTSSGNFQEFNFGQSAFAHTVPTGFLPLDSSNLPDPAIVDPSAYFQTTLYAGNGTAIGSGGKVVDQTETSTFQPDFVWIKNRDQTDNHMLYNVVRGVTKDLHSNAAEAEVTDTEGLSTFDSDGFTVGSNVEVNTNTENYAAWQWKSGNSSGSTNTEGSVDSTVTVDTTAGFSISTFVGTGSALTAGHGLGVAPDFIIAKIVDSTTNWNVYHGSMGNTKALRLNLDGAVQTHEAYWGNTSPTSTVTTFGFTASINVDTKTTLAYSFAAVDGFSAFGSYEGTGSATAGTMVNLGFRPALIILKSMDSTSDWFMFDDKREGYNVDNDSLLANTTGAETTTDMVDLVSNGFKLRIATDPNVAETYIYAAFAENPFKYANAR